ncbi:phage terminase small subunit P27 family [Clostridium sp. FP1]|uniref:phage terminase small subunit P27 family n=1 Tax=Clostridium sp. FP1 TaxID=2724076 RepID=UPI0013E90941|nr:phage terminase small subunit P27 family [Clostridium sp. FP1]MBZ9635508.1 phage terminase small subunit P27 family [Clostridium sp. FP1]
MPSRKSINNIDTKKGGYTKEQIEYRQQQEKKANGDCDKFTMPPFIKGNKIAEKEFKKLTKELKERKVLSNVDSTQLAMYCNCYSTYCECIRLENDKGLFSEYTNKAGETNLVEAPWIKLKRATETQMINIAIKFGFSPADRLKFTSVTKPEVIENPVAKAIRGESNAD